MASLSGSFSGPGATPSVAYLAGASVTVSLAGEWPRAIINAEVSSDSGASWTPVLVDLGIAGTRRVFIPEVGTTIAQIAGPASVLHPPGAGLFRLNCLEWRSGWCNWTISTP